MDDMKKQPKWKNFEELAYGIQKDIASDADVKFNKKILGKITGKKRQIDILITKVIGQFNLSIAIECKDYSNAIDVKKIEEICKKILTLKIEPQYLQIEPVINAIKKDTLILCPFLYLF